MATEPENVQTSQQPAGEEHYNTQGLPVLNPQAANQEQYGGLGQQAIAGLEGVGRGVISAPGVAIAERVLKKAGVPGTSAKAQLGREQANPVTSAVAEGLGMVGSDLAGIGAGAALAKAGEAAKVLTGLSEANKLSRIGSSAVKGIVEMGLYQGQDELAKKLLHDPAAASESALAHIGLASALGGAGGALLGSLASHLGGIETEEGSIRLSDELAKKTGIPIAPEYAAKIDNIAGADQLHSTLSQTDTSSAGRAYQKGLEELNNNLGEGLAHTVGADGEHASNLSTVDKYTSGQQIGSDLVKDLKTRVAPITEEYELINEKLKNAPLSYLQKAQASENIAKKALENGLHVAADSAPLDLVNKVLEALPKQRNAEDIKKFITNLTNAHPFGKETYQTAKEIKAILKETQESAIQEAILKRGGDPAQAAMQVDAYKALKQRYSALMDTFDGLNEHLHVGKYYGPESFLNNLQEMVDTKPEDVLNRLAGKTRADQLKTLGEISPNALDKIRQYHADNLLRSSLTKEGKINPYKFTKEFDKLSPQLQDVVTMGAGREKIDAIKQIADNLIDKNHNYSNTARTLGKLTHGAVSPITLAMGLFGHTGGAVLAHLASLGYKEGKDALKLAMLKFLGSNKPVQAESFKAVANLMHNAIKGENMLQKGAESVFEPTAAVAVSRSIDSAEREKLDKLVEQQVMNPEQRTASINNPLGHYAEEHQGAVTQNIAAQINYLSSLKPQPSQNFPLAKPFKPTAQQESRYNRALDIAIAPGNLYKDIKKGTLRSTDVVDLKNLYPTVYNTMNEKLGKQMVEVSAKGKNLPYSTRMGLSMFMGQPLDASMSPLGIQNAQPLPKPAQPQQDGGMGKPKRGTATLGKSNKSYMTQSQAGEHDREGRTA
jgi:hypothetical protein